MLSTFRSDNDDKEKEKDKDKKEEPKRYRSFYQRMIHKKRRRKSK